MTVGELARRLGWVWLGGGDEDRPVEGGYTSDLLSDVIGNAPPGAVLLTIQAHKNTVAVASHADLAAVVLCSNREAPSDMLQAAETEGLPIYRTADNQFLASARLARELGVV